MTQISLETPEIGKPDKTEDPKIITCFTTIQTAINGNLDSTNLKPASVTGESLDPTVTGLRMIAEGGGLIGGSAAVGTYLPSTSGGAVIKATAGSVEYTAATGAPPMFKIRTSEFEVPTKSLYLTLAIDLWVNGTAPSASMIFSLYKLLTIGGVTSQIVPSFSAPVAGTGVTVTTPAADTASYETKKVASPGEGTYAVGVETNGITAAACFMGFAYRVYLSNQ